MLKKARYIKDLSKQSVPKKECDKGSACFDKKIIRLGKGNRKYLGVGKVLVRFKLGFAFNNSKVQGFVLEIKH